MPKTFTKAQIEQFKSQAQRLYRESKRKGESLPQRKAYDLVANAQGFSSWSLLMRFSGKSPVTTQIPFGICPIFEPPNGIVGHQSCLTAPYHVVPGNYELLKVLENELKTALKNAGGHHEE